MDSPSTSTRSPKDLQKIKKQQNDKENIKSCFSDDEVKMGEESRDDVTYLAEKEDVLKGSRADLFATMSARLKSMSPKKLKNNKDDAQGAASPTYNSWNIPQQKERAITLYKAANEDESPQKRTEKPFIYELDEQIPNQADVQESVPSLNDIKIKVEDKVSLPTIPEIAFNQDLSSRNDIKELPVLEGFLQKKTTNMFKPWQRRYFVLKNHKLYYYLDQNQEIKYGVFDFDLITVKLQKGQNEPTIMISIVGNSRVFVLKAANEQERENWFEALRVHSLYSKGGYVDLSTVAKISKFWKNDRISPETFLQHAETGDILLFKSETIVSKIQRSVTLSEYDHIALLYRHRNNRLFLFEAMREGVGLCGWDVFTEKNWHKLYSKIVYRKLMVPRTPEITKELELFIKSNVGKKYKITPQKLLQKKAKAGKEENTFFCSELVAACYKKLKFLPGDISSAYYFPNSFTAKKKLQLLNDARLSQEYLIDFNI